jgi:hypothetical protein
MRRIFEDKEYTATPKEIDALFRGLRVIAFADSNNYSFRSRFNTAEESGLCFSGDLGIQCQESSIGSRYESASTGPGYIEQV